MKAKKPAKKTVKRDWHWAVRSCRYAVMYYVCESKDVAYWLCDEGEKVVKVKITEVKE